VTACSSFVSPDKFFGDGRALAAPGDSTPASAVSSGASGTASAPAGGLAVGATGSGSPGQGGTGPGGGAADTGSAPGGGAVAGVSAGNCAGFSNTRGISNSAITVANIADLSGPVPGLFTSVQQAANAYVAYFNATSRICGRKLKLAAYDSETSGTGDQQAAIGACGNAFAAVGSVGAFDSGGAKTVADCGIPDLRAVSTTPERTHSPVSYGTDAVDPNLVSTSQYEYIKHATGSAYRKSALLYLNAGASPANALAYKKTMQALGYDFVYTQPVDVTDINYAPYAAKMKSLGVSLVQFEGTASFAVRLKHAMSDQNLNPVFVMDSVAYDPAFVVTAGHDLDGMYTYVDTALFEEASRSAELRRYVEWLHRVAPSAQPSFFGMFAWGAMKLFTQLAVQLGGRLNRQTLLTAIRGTHAFTANGLFAAQDVGGKKTTPCQAVIQLVQARWVRRSPYPYSCATVYNAG
jgi:ABC-type branched-subunit amino acid transport system substrate-binding protein